jgi:hypothetical protein
MTAVLVGLVILVLIVAALLLLRLTAESRQQKKLVQRVRTTNLYSHLYPMFRRYDNEYLESVILRPEGVRIRTITGSEKHYTFRKHGLDNPSDDTLYAIALATLVDMRILRNTRNYVFRSHAEMRPNGDKGFWYDYVITHDRKDTVLRATSGRH